MNLESMPSKKAPLHEDEDFFMEDFDFKPITSGLGFHNKPAEVKPVFTERSIPTSAPIQPKKEMQVYQNDLSMFYGQGQTTPPLPMVEEVKEVRRSYKLASKSQRVLAYTADLLLIPSLLAMVITVMARMISMDVVEAWMTYPNEMTPLAISLFIGFYLMYFSIFEKAPGSTLGKTLFGIKVVSQSDKPVSFGNLLLRGTITLLNFLSLGLFSYFDLQNKITDSKVVKGK